MYLQLVDRDILARYPLVEFMNGFVFFARFGFASVLSRFWLASNPDQSRV